MESLAAMGEQSANYDEMSMHQTILFADSLKDLKNLKTQLYSAAEYFELSYINDDQKHIVVETLKDYAIKAIINTVDHLGSINYKVADLLEEKLEQVSDAEIRVSCIEQRVRTCKEYIDREGVAQQASIIHAPIYHKRYILPAGKTIKGGASVASLKQNGCKLDDEDEWNQLRSAVRATLGGAPESSFSMLNPVIMNHYFGMIPTYRKGRSCSSSPASRPLSRLAGTFSFSLRGGNIPTPNKDLDGRRSVSPQRFTLLRSGSLATPSSAPTTPKSVVQQRQQQQQQLQLQRHLSKPGKSASMRVHDDNERGRKKEVQRYPSKSKRLLMALLTRRKSNKDEMLYTFLDEY